MGGVIPYKYEGFNDPPSAKRGFNAAMVARLVRYGPVRQKKNFSTNTRCDRVRVLSDSQDTATSEILKLSDRVSGRSLGSESVC